MPDLSVWPTDGADGSVSSEARWRKMARLWVPSGVRRDADLTPVLAAGPAVQVAIGQAWVDGHLCELTTPQSVPVTTNGLLVVRFTPADNHAELLYRDAATVPTQTDATWELPIAQMIAGVMSDRRAVLSTAAEVGGAITSALNGITAIWPATTNVVPGIQVNLSATGLWLVTASFDMEVSVAAAGVFAYGMIVATNAVLPLAASIPNRTGVQMGQVGRRFQLLTLPVRVDAPNAAFVNLCGAKSAAGGTFNIAGDAVGTWLHAHRIAA